MTKFALVILATPQEGKFDEYNQWHMNEHAPDVMKVPGFKVGRRYRRSAYDYQPGGPKWEFCTIYEIEAESAEAAMDESKRRSANGEIMRSALSDPSKTVMLSLDFVSEHFPPADR